MAVDQLMPNILVALTLIPVVVFVRLIAFAQLNWKLRRALRDRPEDVPALAAKVPYTPWIFDLGGLAVIAAAIALALLASQESGDDRKRILEMAIVTGVTGLAVLAYVQFERRRQKKRLSGYSDFNSQGFP